MLPNTPTILPETPSQTAGPFLHIGMAPSFAGIAPWPNPTASATPISPETEGERIRLTLTVLDATGTPLHDALIESWQADARGLYPPEAPHFTGLARLLPDADGQFTLQTVRPGAVAGQSPHLTLWLVARGINTGLHTRVYFPEDTERHATDPVLSRIEQPARRETLIARKTGDGTYTHKIHLQGDRETVFLDI